MSLQLNESLKKTESFTYSFDELCVGKKAGTESPEYDNLTAAEIFNAKCQIQIKNNFCRHNEYLFDYETKLINQNVQLLKNNIEFTDSFVNLSNTQNDKIAGLYLIIIYLNKQILFVYQNLLKNFYYNFFKI